MGAWKTSHKRWAKRTARLSELIARCIAADLWVIIVCLSLIFELKQNWYDSLWESFQFCLPGTLVHKINYVHVLFAVPRFKGESIRSSKGTFWEIRLEIFMVTVKVNAHVLHPPAQHSRNTLANSKRRTCSPSKLVKKYCTLLKLWPDRNPPVSVLWLKYIITAPFR